MKKTTKLKKLVAVVMIFALALCVTQIAYQEVNAAVRDNEFTGINGKKFGFSSEGGITLKLKGNKLYVNGVLTYHDDRDDELHFTPKLKNKKYILTKNCKVEVYFEGAPAGDVVYKWSLKKFIKLKKYPKKCKGAFRSASPGKKGFKDFCGVDLIIKKGKISKIHFGM